VCVSVFDLFSFMKVVASSVGLSCVTRDGIFKVVSCLREDMVPEYVNSDVV
jgi:hypothetical protein